MSLKAKGFGQTIVGFNRPAPADILTDLQQGGDAATGLVWRKDATAVWGGQLCGVVTAALDELWGEELNNYSSRDIRVAVGAALDGLCALNDVFRAPPRPSTGVAICVGTAGATLFAGDIVESQDNALVYALVPASTVLANAPARATTQPVAQGAVYSNSGKCYAAMVGGTTGGGAGPSGSGAWGSLETDGTVQWQYLGAGLAFAPISMASSVAGPIGGSAGSISKIGTPRAGWSSVVNIADVSVGRLTEIDEQLRIRYFAALSGIGKASADAVRAALLDPENGIGTEGCTVYENATAAVDSDGLPSACIEPVITAPVGVDIDLLIAQVILATKAAGIATSGTTTVSVSDASGKQHAISFTRPAPVAIYQRITVKANSQASAIAPTGQATLSVPSNGADLAQAAALGFESLYPVSPGMKARHGAIEIAVGAAEIPGVLDVDVQLDTVPITNQPPGDVAVDIRHYAAFDSSRTAVAVVFERP